MPGKPESTVLWLATLTDWKEAVPVALPSEANPADVKAAALAAHPELASSSDQLMVKIARCSFCHRHATHVFDRRGNHTRFSCPGHGAPNEWFCRPCWDRR